MKDVFKYSANGVDLRTTIDSLVKGRQEEISKALGISRASISTYLNNRSEMTSKNIEAIINYCIANPK